MKPSVAVDVWQNVVVEELSVFLIQPRQYRDVFHLVLHGMPDGGVRITKVGEWPSVRA
jgi:hypothetical protein